MSYLEWRKRRLIFERRSMTIGQTFNNSSRSVERFEAGGLWSWIK